MKLCTVFLSLGCAVMLLSPFVAAAQNPRKQPCNDQDFGFLEVPFPGVPSSICKLASGDAPLTTYAQLLIDFFTAFIVGVGLIMMVVAGYMYMTAGGDASRTGSAKTILKTALLGIVLALAAYTILYTLGGDQFFQEPKFVLPSPTP